MPLSTILVNVIEILSRDLVDIVIIDVIILVQSAPKVKSMLNFLAQRLFCLS